MNIPGLPRNSQPIAFRPATGDRSLQRQPSGPRIPWSKTTGHRGLSEAITMLTLAVFRTFRYERTAGKSPNGFVIRMSIFASKPCCIRHIEPEFLTFWRPINFIFCNRFQIPQRIQYIHTQDTRICSRYHNAGMMRIEFITRSSFQHCILFTYGQQHRITMVKHKSETKRSRE